MGNERKGKQILLRLCFLAYCGLMLWLLFGRSPYDVADGYWEQMHQNLNLKPFATIKLYLYVLTAPELARHIPAAIVNLAGNVVMFVPLGAFLPAIWQGLRALWKTLLCTAFVICLIETAQLLTLVGSCDVDDLLLNVLGAALGYGGYRLILICNKE